MASTLKIISSMATKQVLAELIALYRQDHAVDIALESVGGVDAAKRVQAGEALDLVMLAQDAIDKLIAGGAVASGSRVDIVRSGVAVAVRAGAPKPDIGSEESLKAAVLAAPTISYSTGPSGVQLVKLFERWGIAEQLQSRTVQAPPGVPVGSLVAKGEAALGFQQLAELIHLPGIDLLGPLPPAVQITTVFSGGIARTAAQPEAARALLAFFASPAAGEAKQRQGMESA
ncbi:MAG TPA: substrate-binding domain-containing protein [Pseudorhodoferax sp.]|jgi:molybdate transport system substrate-binding protein|nr:substrate-binding domain-containing protein [Pseudorhodoferax sp.]